MTETQAALPEPATSYFPSHTAPRVWAISAGDSPVGISLTRKILAHGDYAVIGFTLAPSPGDEMRRGHFDDFLSEVEDSGWSDRFRTVALDVRMMGECQAAIAEVVNSFGRIDILVCCTSQAIVGSVEELAASQRTMNLARDQFETNYFGPVHLIKASLPQFRQQKSGHIMVLGGITGHIGTPGLGMYCAAGWALEGFCDSIAYEIAPFNIKLTILQCSIEIGVLANRVTSVPPILPAYSAEQNPAPLFRGIMNGLLSRLAEATGPEKQSNSPPSPMNSSPTMSSDLSGGRHGTAETESAMETGNAFPLSKRQVVSLYPPLTSAHLEILTAEAIHAITAIGGHENPPARHIVGTEGVASVKEKLKTVSEELEDFIDSSCAVDFDADEVSTRAVRDDAASKINL